MPDESAPAAALTETQAAFLRESLLADSDWADVVDRLGKALLSPTLT